MPLKGRQWRCIRPKEVVFSFHVEAKHTSGSSVKSMGGGRGDNVESDAVELVKPEQRGLSLMKGNWNLRMFVHEKWKCNM